MSQAFFHDEIPTKNTYKVEFQLALSLTMGKICILLDFLRPSLEGKRKRERAAQESNFKIDNCQLKSSSEADVFSLSPRALHFLSIAWFIEYPRRSKFSLRNIVGSEERKSQIKSRAIEIIIRSNWRHLQSENKSTRDTQNKRECFWSLLYSRTCCAAMQIFPIN